MPAESIDFAVFSLFVIKVTSFNENNFILCNL